MRGFCGRQKERGQGGRKVCRDPRARERTTREGGGFGREGTSNPQRVAQRRLYASQILVSEEKEMRG